MRLADEALEDALYHSQMHAFMEIDLSLASSDLIKSLFDDIDARGSSRNCSCVRERIVNAKIITVPSSTNNASSARDPEMDQTSKDSGWSLK